MIFISDSKGLQINDIGPNLSGYCQLRIVIKFNQNNITKTILRKYFLISTANQP